MNWYKIAQSNQVLLQEARKYKSVEEFGSNLNTDILDKIAFGFKSGDIKTFNPNELNIVYADDLKDAAYQQKVSGMSQEEWAKSVNLSDPIEVYLENDKFSISDGHHRYLASKILNVPIQAIVIIKDNPVPKLGYQDYNQLIEDIYNKANSQNTIEDEARKYQNLQDFENNYKILYHGGSENIIGDKLSLGGRLPKEITEENLGTGQDYGGIFFTPEIEMAKTFSNHSSSGVGKVHTFVVRQNNLFSEDNPKDVRKLQKFIGKTYLDEDREEVEFTQQMYDFIFPKLADGKRHMDWATFNPNILETMGFEGAKVIEQYDTYGDGKHLFSTVLFTGGQGSPHWKINEEQTLADIHKGANKIAKNKNWYKKAQQQKILWIMRGISGSGKSTLANKLVQDGVILGTDDFFETENEYQYDFSRIEEAHQWNIARAEEMMQKGISPIVIDNTNVGASAMKPYVENGLKYGYKIEMAEPNTPWKFNAEELAQRNKHGTSKEIIQEMLDKWEPDLTVKDIMESQDGLV